MSGNTGAYEIIVYNPDGKDTDLMKGRILRTWTYQTDHRHELNPWYGDWGHCMIRKEGSKFTFFYWGGYHTFIVPEAANLVAAKIQISCKAWRASNGKNLYIHGFDVFDFRKMGQDPDILQGMASEQREELVYPWLRCLRLPENGCLQVERRAQPVPA